MASGYGRYGLRTNPFSPVVAEERPKELLVIVGREYERVREFIERRYNDAVNKKILNFVVLKGVRGSGKSAIIMNFKYRVEDRARIIYFRLSSTCNFRMTIALFIREIIRLENRLLDYFRGDNVIEDILARDISELDYELRVLHDKLFNVLSRLGDGKPLIIIWDQLENLSLEEDERQEFLNFIRNVSTYLPKSIGTGVLFIIAITPEKYVEITEILGSEMAFIRNLEAGAIEMPRRMEFNDVRVLFRKLLGIVRVMDENIREKLKIYPYYPFTEDAIKAIYDLADGVPGAIYEIASKVIDEAISYSDIEVIDERFVHDIVLEIDPEWYRALTKPIVPINELVHTLLEGAKELDIIRDFQRLVLRLENYRHIVEAFSITKAFSEGRISKDEYDNIVKKHILDYIVIYEKEGGFYITLIRTARITIRSDTAEDISSLLNRLTGFKYGIATISRERMRYVIITYGEISGRPKSILEQASITSGIPIDIIEINTSSPYVYGRIYSVYERISKLKKLYGRLKAVPYRTKTTLHADIVDALAILNIISV